MSTPTNQRSQSQQQEEEPKGNSSVLDTLSNARAAAKEARQPLQIYAKHPELVAKDNKNNTSSSSSSLFQNAAEAQRDLATSGRGSSSISTSFPFLNKNSLQQQQQTQQQNPERELSVLHRPLSPRSNQQHHRYGGDNINASGVYSSPTSPNSSSSVLGFEHEMQLQAFLETARSKIPDQDLSWFERVAAISDQEMKAANQAASVELETIDEYGQLGEDFLTGLDEQQWDFNADLFGGDLDLTSSAVDVAKKAIEANEKSIAEKRNNNNTNNDISSASASSNNNNNNASASGKMLNEFSNSAQRKKHAEKTTFWTLRRIIEKQQSRLKSVIQQRDTYKTLLGRYSYVGSELRSAAKRCDAATTVLSDRYRRIVAGESGNRAAELQKPLHPPGTVVFGNPSSMQAKEISELSGTMASFPYPVEGNASFVVQPHIFTEEKSIVSPSVTQQGLGVPARGVDWDVVQNLENDAANVISSTHDEEVRHLMEQLKSAYRRHCRDIKTVATMRRAVTDSIDHADHLKNVIHERDATIDQLNAVILTRDKTIELEKEHAAKLKGQIDELMKLRWELDEELGKAGDQEQDLSERLTELKEIIRSATEKSDREARQRKDESARLRVAMQSYQDEMAATVEIWKRQWSQVRVRSRFGKTQEEKRLDEEEVQRKRKEDENQMSGGSGSGDSQNANVSSADVGDSASLFLQQHQQKSKQEMDFTSQWMVLNEMFEHKRVELSSRCSFDVVATWNYIFKAVLDLWLFNKTLQDALKKRDERLQNQYATFEEQIRPLLSDLRDIESIGTTGEKGSSTGGGSLFASLRNMQERKKALLAASAAGGSGSSSSAAELKKKMAEEEALKRNPMMLRKEVVAGIEKFSKQLNNIDDDDISPITRSFAQTLVDLFLKNDSVWSDENEKLKKELAASKDKLAETQMNLATSESVGDELKRTVEELRAVVNESQRRRSLWSANENVDWSEGCPVLANSLDALEARFDHVRSMLSRGGSMPASEISKLRSEVVEDLEHLEKTIKSIVADDSMTAFPEGFLPTAILSKIMTFFLGDCRWIQRAVSHSATEALKNLSAETISDSLTSLRRYRFAQTLHPPSAELAENHDMSEQELFGHARNAADTPIGLAHGLHPVGAPLRKFFNVMSHIGTSIVSLQKQLTQTQTSHSSSNNNTAAASTSSSSSSNVTIATPLLSGLDVSAVLQSLNSILQISIEELRATLLVGSIGEWSGVHRALIRFASATEEQTKSLSNENHVKIGSASSATSICQSAIEAALDVAIGPSTRIGGSGGGGDAFAALPVIQKAPQQPRNLEEAIVHAKMDTATARYLLARFQELILCRGGMSSSFLEPYNGPSTTNNHLSQSQDGQNEDGAGGGSKRNMFRNLANAISAVSAMKGSSSQQQQQQQQTPDLEVVGGGGGGGGKLTRSKSSRRTHWTDQTAGAATSPSSSAPTPLAKGKSKKNLLSQKNNSKQTQQEQQQRDVNADIEALMQRAKSSVSFDNNTPQGGMQQHQQQQQHAKTSSGLSTSPTRGNNSKTNSPAKSNNKPSASSSSVSNDIFNENVPSSPSSISRKLLVDTADSETQYDPPPLTQEEEEEEEERLKISSPRRYTVIKKETTTPSSVSPETQNLKLEKEIAPTTIINTVPVELCDMSVQTDNAHLFMQQIQQQQHQQQYSSRPGSASGSSSVSSFVTQQQFRQQQQQQQQVSATSPRSTSGRSVNLGATITGANPLSPTSARSNPSSSSALSSRPSSAPGSQKQQNQEQNQQQQQQQDQLASSIGNESLSSLPRSGREGEQDSNAIVVLPVPAEGATATTTTSSSQKSSPKAKSHELEEIENDPAIPMMASDSFGGASSSFCVLDSNSSNNASSSGTKQQIEDEFMESQKRLQQLQEQQQQLSVVTPAANWTSSIGGTGPGRTRGASVVAARKDPTTGGNKSPAPPSPLAGSFGQIPLEGIVPAFSLTPNSNPEQQQFQIPQQYLLPQLQSTQQNLQNLSQHEKQQLLQQQQQFQQYLYQQHLQQQAASSGLSPFQIHMQHQQKIAQAGGGGGGGSGGFDFFSSTSAGTENINQNNLHLQQQQFFLLQKHGLLSPQQIQQGIFLGFIPSSSHNTGSNASSHSSSPFSGSLLSVRPERQSQFGNQQQQQQQQNQKKNQKPGDQKERQENKEGSNNQQKKEGEKSEKQDISLTSPLSASASSLSFGGGNNNNNNNNNNNSVMERTFSPPSSPTPGGGGGERIKKQMNTRSTQVHFDAVEKPQTSTSFAQTDHTTHRQFVSSVNVAAAHMATPVSSSSSASASASASASRGSSAKPAVDHHRPSNSSEWVEASWKKSELMVDLPEQPSERQRYSMSKEIATQFQQRPPTPARCEMWRSPSAKRRAEEEERKRLEDAAPLASWKIRGGGGAMFLLKLEKPSTNNAVDSSRHQRNIELQKEREAPWQPGSKQDEKFKHPALLGKEDDENSARRRKTRLDGSELSLRHKKFPSPSKKNKTSPTKTSPTTTTPPKRARSSDRTSLTPSSVNILSQEIADELHKLLIGEHPDYIRPSSSSSFSSNSSSSSSRNRHQTPSRHNHHLQEDQEGKTTSEHPPLSLSQHYHNQEEVERIRELSYMRKKLEKAGALSPSSLSNQQNQEQEQEGEEQQQQRNQHHLKQLEEDEATQEAIDRELLSNVPPPSALDVTPVSALKDVPRYSRGVRPLSSSQRRVISQYEADGLTYEPPPTALENSLDKEFCRQIGLTPSGAVRFQPQYNVMRRPESATNAKLKLLASSSSSPSSFGSAGVGVAGNNNNNNNNNINASTPQPASSSSSTTSASFISRTVERALRQQQEKAAREHAKLQSQALVEEQQERERVSKTEMNSKMQNLVNETTYSQPPNERRGEFANVTSLAKELVGNSSVLARRLQHQK